MDLKSFIKDYKKRLCDLILAVDDEVVTAIVEAFEKTVENKSSIYVIGNGGSAATASHWENDFAIGLKRRGIVTFDMTSLADNSAVCTAIANDLGYDKIFQAQLDQLLHPEDVILAISCSGNSPNIVDAVQYANEVGATVIGCTGFDGGKLREMSDICFHIDAPVGEYGLVEDVHMILDHIIYSYYIQKNDD